MHLSSFAPIALFSIWCGTPLPAAIIESVNADFSPQPSSSWAAVDVGWLYTPALSYRLTEVETKFRTADGRGVTLDIYSGAPSSGGTLLRSSTFVPAGGVFSGGSFDPLFVTSGQQFFIGFRNVSGLGVNTVTSSSGSQSLGPDYFDLDGSATYASHFGFTTGDVDHPILRLDGTAVPEPATCAFVGFALILFVFAGCRRQRTGTGSRR